MRNFNNVAANANIWVMIMLMFWLYSVTASEKNRLIVLTDIGGDKFHGRFDGADYSLVTNEWLDRNVRSKGPLGAVYPRWELMMEGDTPSFLNLINNGLSDHDGDALSFEWFCYEEPGTRRMSNVRTGVKHDITAFDQPKAWLTVKTTRVMPPSTGTMHIILAVTDHGRPCLTRYKRVIIDVVK